MEVGNQIYNFCKELWPINRSITGDGVRKTLKKIKEILPQLSIHEVPTGTDVFDWKIPKEWVIRDAWIKTPDGKKICDFKTNNLYLVGYSTPIHKRLTLSELKKNLHSLPEMPDAIPYVTSYYEERWGFCISENEKKNLVEGEYEVFIDSDLIDGFLTYGELLIKGQSQEEVFLSTYICHPSMANNELSGPTVTSFISKWLVEQSNLKYSYRIIFIPETIGSITYLSKNIDHLKSNVKAGFNISCVGDDRDYSYLPSRNGNTLSDKISQHVLNHIHPSYKIYDWSERGSDERQYCSPGIDLPIASIMRSKYGKYDEYHTSLDDLKNVVSPEGLAGGYNALKLAIEALENNIYPKTTVLCEPNLGKRNLYPTLSGKKLNHDIRLLKDVLTWSDGTMSLIEIADIIRVPVWDLYPIVEILSVHNLISKEDHPQK